MRRVKKTTTKMWVLEREREGERRQEIGTLNFIVTETLIHWLRCTLGGSLKCGPFSDISKQKKKKRRFRPWDKVTSLCVCKL